MPEKINNQDAKTLISKLFSTNIENLNNHFGLAEKVFQDLKRFIEFLNKLDEIEKIKQEKFIFDDCSLMNCIYAGAFIFLIGFFKTIKYINKIFDINHEVLPNSIENNRPIALRENGELLLQSLILLV